MFDAFVGDEDVVVDVGTRCTLIIGIAVGIAIACPDAEERLDLFGYVAVDDG
jgi:hypothetical protein